MESMKQPAFESLRKRAEQILRDRGPGSTDDAEDLDLMRLIQELEVYQVELELQNEELRRSARELEVARNEYFDLYDSAPVGFVTVSPSGIIERFNAAAAQMLGDQGTSLTGRSFLTRVFRYDQDVYFSCLSIAAKKADPCELRLIGRDGTVVHVYLEAVSKRDLDGNLTHWRLTLVDITERKRTEVLRKSEERFREAFEYAPTGIYLSDLEGRLLHVNDACCRMLGYSREELTGTGITFRKLIHPEDSEDTMTAFNRLMAGEIPAFFMEKRYSRKDGKIIWVRESVAMRRDDAGNPTQIVGIIEDINPRVEAEEQLRQAHKMEAIRCLAGGVAHEFNNMLNVILGYAQILASRLKEESTLQDYVREIITAAQRSADMTDQLLAYSRKQPIQPELIDLTQVIHDQEPMLRLLIGEENDLSFNLGDDLWSVLIDPSQVDQILANLAVNARDAVQSAGRVTIQTENIPIDRSNAMADLPPGEYVRLTFGDTGTGMEKLTLERIFDPYFTTRDVGKGAGLGLSMIYGIVKQNKGAIEVRSELGKGTTFQIYFPACRLCGKP